VGGDVAAKNAQDFERQGLCGVVWQSAGSANKFGRAPKIGDCSRLMRKRALSRMEMVVSLQQGPGFAPSEDYPSLEVWHTDHGH
jgi:hypothetical protein